VKPDRNKEGVTMATKRPTVLHIVLAALAAACAAGCSDSSSGPPPNRAVTPVDAATAGTIRVRVAYAGKVPEPKVINMSGSAPCAELHPEPVKDNSVIVSDGKLAGAVVSIKSGLGDRAFGSPEQPVIFVQKGCL
jgi:hypothetical protein